jgi:hypothetical protein
MIMIHPRLPIIDWTDDGIEFDEMRHEDGNLCVLCVWVVVLPLTGFLEIFGSCKYGGFILLSPFMLPLCDYEKSQCL